MWPSSGAEHGKMAFSMGITIVLKYAKDTSAIGLCDIQVGNHACIMVQCTRTVAHRQSATVFFSVIKLDLTTAMCVTL